MTELTVNVIGHPGAGKSTVASIIYRALTDRGISCSLFDTDPNGSPISEELRVSSLISKDLHIEVRAVQAQRRS